MKQYLAVLTMFVAGSALCQEAGADKKAIEGAWKPISAELAGMKLSDVQIATITLTMVDGMYTVQAGKSVDKGTYKIDSAAKPKAIDIVGTEGPNRGKILLAIFEVENDTLRVCYDLAGKNRPTEFASSKEKPFFFIVYQRAKP